MKKIEERRQNLSRTKSNSKISLSVIRSKRSTRSTYRQRLNKQNYKLNWHLSTKIYSSRTRQWQTSSNRQTNRSWKSRQMWRPITKRLRKIMESLSKHWRLRLNRRIKSSLIKLKRSAKTINSFMLRIANYKRRLRLSIKRSRSKMNRTWKTEKKNRNLSKP